MVQVHASQAGGVGCMHGWENVMCDIHVGDDPRCVMGGGCVTGWQVAATPGAHLGFFSGGGRVGFSGGLNAM